MTPSVREALQAVKFLGIAATCDKCEPETARRVGLALDDIREFIEAQAGAKVTDQPKPVATVDREPFEPMACCGRERDKDGGPNPHCECPAPLKLKPVAPLTTPSEQLAQRILAGSLPMLAQYVAEVTLRLDEMAADKPEPPTALTELRTIPGATGANADPMRMVDRLQTELSEARAKLAELEQSRVEYLALSRAELAKVTAERDEARAELAVVRVKLYDAVSAHNENLTRSFDSDMVLRDKLAKVTAERDELRSTLANINADRANTRAVVEAARFVVTELASTAWLPPYAIRALNRLEAALSALDKPAAADVKETT